MKSLKAIEIVIRVDIDKDKVLFHLERMLLLGEKLLDNGCNVNFLCRFSADAESILNEYPQFGKTFYLPGTEEQEVIDFYVKNCNIPDIWVFDISSLSESTISHVKKIGGITVSFDDWSGGFRHSDCVINSFTAWDKKFDLLKPHNKLFCEPQYIITHDNLPLYKLERYSTSDSLRIAVFFDGKDTNGSTLHALRVLQVVESVKMIHVTFYLSDFFEHTYRFKTQIKLVNYKFNVKRISRTSWKELPDYHFVICDTQQVVFELLSIGIPAMVVVSSQQDRRIFEYISNHGIFIEIGSNSGIMTQQVIDNLSFFDDSSSKTLQYRAFISSHGGASACAKKILELAE